MNNLSQKENSRLSTVLPRPKRPRRKSLKFWYKSYQYRFHRYLKTLKGDPENLARGLAIGVFAGCFPFFGLQSLLGILLATIFRGSKVAAVTGTWISNPLTYVPIFVFNFNVGKLLLGVQKSFADYELNYESLHAWKELGYTFTIVLLLGCLVVGSVLSVIGYFVGLHFFKRLKQNSNKHQRSRNSKKI